MQYYQNSPSFVTLTLNNSLSLLDKPSHSQDLSLHGPVHSPLANGFLKRTSGVSPLTLRTLANPVTL